MRAIGRDADITLPARIGDAIPTNDDLQRERREVTCSGTRRSFVRPVSDNRACIRRYARAALPEYVVMAPTMQTDSELVARVPAPDAVQALYERHVNAVLRFAIRGSVSCRHPARAVPSRWPPAAARDATGV